MEPIWLKSYPAGVEPEVRYDQYRSVGDLFDKCVAQFSARPAYSSMGKSLRYGELDKLSRDFGAWLQAKGLGKGARVAIMLPNVLQYPVALFGTLRAGCTVVNVNPLYTARELEHQLKDSGAEAIVILENFAHTLAAVLARTPLKHVVVASLGDLLGVKGAIVNFVVRKLKKMVPAFALPKAQRFNAVLAEGARKPFEPYDAGHDDIAFLQYTGGTTGLSKGAMLLHRNILANIEQVAGWLELGLKGEAPVDHHRAAAVSHLRPDGELPGDPQARRLEHPDHQPARHPGLRQGARQAPLQHDHRRQHAVQRAAATIRISPSSTSRRSGSRAAAAWRCKRRSPTAGRRSPARFCSRATA